MGKRAAIKPVVVVEISWDGRGYGRDSWERDKQTAKESLPEGPLFFYVTTDNTLIIATAPVSYRLIEDAYEDRFEEDGWVEYENIDDFEREESHLFESLEV